MKMTMVMMTTLMLGSLNALAAEKVVEKPIEIKQVLYSSPLELLGRNAQTIVQSTAIELCGGQDRLVEVRDLTVSLSAAKNNMLNGSLFLVYPVLNVAGIAVCK